ncbi:MAG: hypothetical protein FWB98_00040 [Defluviitaleaceae bacterium]|nr:hypothetical protein [Defluviitaleaceae bacterium]
MVKRSVLQQSNNQPQSKEGGEKFTATATTKTIGGKKYSVKSVFLGNTDKDIKSLFLSIAERKAITEMGLGT